MSYSNGSGGTLTLPSPTHVHHVDVSSTVRSLRRSLSRSPSKFRLSGIASPSPVKSTIFRQSPTPTPTPIVLFEPPAAASLPATPAPPAASFSPIASTAPQLGVTAATPFRPSLKLPVRSTRSKQVNRPLSRSRVSPKSPLKRVFGPSPDSGNQVPSSAASGAAGRGPENATLTDFPIALSPATRRNLERPSRHSMHLDVTGSTKNGISKFLEMNSDQFPAISVSPLKRSDATMSLGHTSFGSPVAKRRSLHGISNVGSTTPPSDQATVPPQNFDIHEDANHEYELTGSCASPFRDAASPTPSALPKRTSSLRKSTLQQRHGENRISLGRRGGEKQLAQFTMLEAPASPARARPRLSLDQYVPPEERGSPFSQEPLPPASLHLMQRPVNQPHPLSRTITQSSSGSSLPDESPTHTTTAPMSERRRALFNNLSKSLPPGAQRPVADSETTATPQYKQARPLQAAFMSTGLVSKMSLHPDAGPPQHPGAKTSTMPDTPCKKQPYSSATFPPGSGSGGRRSRISFGSPSTPFSLVAAPVRGNLFGTQDKSGSLLFQPPGSSHTRKGSMLSLDGDDLAAVHDELPPTPTKNLFFRSITTPSEAMRTSDDKRSFAARAPAFFLGRDPRVPDVESEDDALHDASATATGEQPGEDSGPDSPRPSTPFGSGSPTLGFTFGSLAGSRTHPVPLRTPAPTRTSPTFFATVNNVANHYDTAVAAGASPHTPQYAPEESMAPPDPSTLSISNHHDSQAKIVGPPATPSNSQGRQLFSSFADRRASITPQNGHGPSDVDESLLARFDKSEVVGKGEFSQVYRVTKSSTPGLLMMGLSTTPRTPASPDHGRVYAVKKLRIPVHNMRARQARLQEVSILQALQHSSKVVHYIDSWEHDSHLYIQTEYCAEGSLDGFLRTVGQSGRLDDFRIWKILLETAQGLSAIHEAGFIHLDIKPANIFITFDGYLKIGDFGLATSWPAAKGIDGEGDREYIAPEILHGQYDKPADIFALGLVILEMACNVFMPDNGPTWVALRNGDLSTVATLTSGEAGAIVRDANGLPIEHDSGISQVMDDNDDDAGLGIGGGKRRDSFPFAAIMTHNASNLFGSQRRTELQHPPSFMLDAADENSLDNVVKKMIHPDPMERLTAENLLKTEPLVWIAGRRSAGATVFEGNWGPQVASPAVADVDELVDIEMMDV